MKKIFVLIISLLLCLSFIYGCVYKGVNSGGADDDNQNKNNDVIAEFSAETISGGNFTNANFADYDLTVINVWTTWCGYCLEEMPYLEQLSSELGENVHFMTLCDDADTEFELAKEILDDNGATFDTIIGNSQTTASIIRPYVSGYPTTLYINSEGVVVGSQVGLPAWGEDVIEAYKEQINSYLPLEIEK